MQAFGIQKKGALDGYAMIRRLRCVDTPFETAGGSQKVHCGRGAYGLAPGFKQSKDMVGITTMYRSGLRFLRGHCFPGKAPSTRARSAFLWQGTAF